jgi:hypothetical protein
MEIETAGRVRFERSCVAANRQARNEREHQRKRDIHLL